MPVKLRAIALSLLVALAFLSCASDSAITPFDLTLDEYMEYYSARAEELGFGSASLSGGGGGVRGFAAFDGLFIICFESDGEGRIYSVDVSTSGVYSEKISGEEDLEQAAVFAGCLVEPFFKGEELARIAGVLLGSLETPGEKLSYTGCAIYGERRPSGGFEFTVYPDR